MAIPISYNLRNLAVRKTTTIMTALGIALSVAILVASLALVNGLRTVFKNTANPLQLLVLRKGGNSELSSIVSTEAFATLRSQAGIAVGQRGEPLASQELVNVMNLPSVDNPKGMNVTVRGLSTTGIEMRKVRLIDGGGFSQAKEKSWLAKRSPSGIHRRGSATGFASAKATGRSSGSWMVANPPSTAKSGATSTK